MGEGLESLQSLAADLERLRAQAEKIRVGPWEVLFRRRARRLVSEFVHVRATVDEVINRSSELLEGGLFDGQKTMGQTLADAAQIPVIVNRLQMLRSSADHVQLLISLKTGDANSRLGVWLGFLSVILGFVAVGLSLALS